MRTTSKPVVQALRIHILEQFAEWEATHYTDDGDCYWTEWDDLGDRDTLETAALLAISAARYYDLADNIEITTDEELREIIRKGRSIRYYYEQQNIGRAKYVINHYDGVKKNRDGSQALDCAIFGSKLKRDLFTKELRAKGYAEKSGLWA